MVVGGARAEEARAAMLALFPEGFEEVDHDRSVELVAYTDGAGEERFAAVFTAARSQPVGDGWEERWRTFHRGARAGSLWVGPPWETPPEGATAVLIDPGRAFGTGSHPTTRLCLELLETVPRGSVLDVGCGSGVLGIAAAKLGFSPVEAVDVDPTAVEATANNARANRVAITVSAADARESRLPGADVGLANLTIADVAAIGPRLRVRWLIASGYLESELPEPAGFEQSARRTAEGWAADLFVERESQAEHSLRP